LFHTPDSPKGRQDSLPVSRASTPHPMLCTDACVAIGDAEILSGVKVHDIAISEDGIRLGKVHHGPEVDVSIQLVGRLE